MIIPIDRKWTSTYHLHHYAFMTYCHSPVTRNGDSSDLSRRDILVKGSK